MASGAPPVPFAVQCMMVASCQFCCVLGGIQVAKTGDEFLSLKLKARYDGMDTPLVSLAAQCVMIPSCLFFYVFGGMLIATAVGEVLSF